MFNQQGRARLYPVLSAWLILTLSACMGDNSNTVAQSGTPATVTPAERPDDVECLGSSIRKQAFFGDLHIHTKLSFDAYFFNSINGPREAYQFAKGENAFLPSGEDPDTPMRQINIGRPLDFAAVTEHAEQLGTFSNICELQGNVPAGTNPACSALGQLIRDNVSVFITGNVPLYLQLITSAGSRVPSTRTWEEIQAVANAENQPCKFTTFNGYEFSSNKGGQVLHRNVIFEGTQVPANVISSIPLFQPPTTRMTNGVCSIDLKLNVWMLKAAMWSPFHTVQIKAMAALRVPASPTPVCHLRETTQH